MLIVSFEDDRLTAHVGTWSDGGYRRYVIGPSFACPHRRYRTALFLMIAKQFVLTAPGPGGLCSVLAPLLGSSIFLAAAAARSQKRGQETSDAVVLGVGAAVGAAVAHFGSKTTEWTFDKAANTVSTRSAPFWRTFASSPRQVVCSCSQLVPKGVAEHATVKPAESGLFYDVLGSLNTSSMRGRLALLLGGKQVTICNHVHSGTVFTLADFLTFDFGAVSKTQLTAEESALCRDMYQTVDANRDGVLQDYELRQIELVMPDEMALLGASAPLIKPDAGCLRWTLRTGAVCMCMYVSRSAPVTCACMCPCSPPSHTAFFAGPPVVSIHTHTHAHTHTHTHTYIYIYTYIYVYTHTHMYICIYTYIHIHIYIHTHTHAHIHIHTHTLSLSLSLTHTHTHTHTLDGRGS